MLRRVLLRAAGAASTAAWVLPHTTFARPAPGHDAPPDRQPITVDRPRIWPAVSRTTPLLLGAVDAFAAPERATEAGVQWGRVLFDWSAIQRRGPDDWSIGAASLETARAERDAGRPLVGLFMSTPSWASGTSDPKSPPLGLDRPLDDPGNVWATWVRSCVSRFAGVIDAWVMWNEPDVWSDDNHAHQWVGTLEQYCTLLKVGYLAAKAANPRSTVLLAGMTYWWDAAYGRRLYFDRLLSVLAADRSAPEHNWYFDAAVLQLYNNPRGLFDAPRIFSDLMRMRGVSKPVWVNETNVVPWDDPQAPLSREHFRATQDEQANYLVQAIAYALAAGVDRVAVFKMLDDSPLKKNVEQAFGMVRADSDHSTRPIFRTYAMLRREIASIVTTRAQLVDGGAIQRIYLEQPSAGRRMTVIWNMTPDRLAVSLDALGATAQQMDRFGNVSPLDVDADGHISVTLGQATANTIPGYPAAYFIGGEPLLIVEPLPSSYEPLAPTYASLPWPGQP